VKLVRGYVALVELDDVPRDDGKYLPESIVKA